MAPPSMMPPAGFSNPMDEVLEEPEEDILIEAGGRGAPTMCMEAELNPFEQQVDPKASLGL